MIERLLRGVALVGTSAFVVAVLLTMTDIGLRSVSTLTVRGAVDLTQLCVIVGAMLAIPYGFLADQHVAIDLFTQRMPLGIQRALRIVAALLATVFLAGVFWFSWLQAGNEAGDRSQTIGIPMTWYWAFFLAGIGLSVAANIVLALRLWRSGPPKA